MNVEQTLRQLLHLLLLSETVLSASGASALIRAPLSLSTAIAEHRCAKQEQDMFTFDSES